MLGAAQGLVPLLCMKDERLPRKEHFAEAGSPLAVRCETDIYNALGLPGYVPPHRRWFNAGTRE